jgi:hypothetical protein
MIMRRVLLWLLLAGIVLLIAAAALLAAGRLLGALDDRPAEKVINVAALVVAAILVLDIISLVFAQGFLLLSLWEEDDVHVECEHTEE